MSIAFLHSHGPADSAAPGSLLPVEVAAGFPLDGVWHEGVSIESLEAGTSLTVRTRHSEYRLTVVDGARREVLVQGGLLFPASTPVRLEGSTAGGSGLKIGWIGIGLGMEISVGRRMISTSPVQSITSFGVVTAP
jgi:hypothetical protein